MSRNTEFGLYFIEENTKVEVEAKFIDDGKYGNVKILIDGKVYDSGKKLYQFGDYIFDCLHEPRGWLL